MNTAVDTTGGTATGSRPSEASAPRVGQEAIGQEAIARDAGAEDGRRLRRLSGVAALLYLVVIVGGIFAEFFVRQGLVVWGDAAATAENIRANESLFQLGVLGDVLAHTSYFFLALALYFLLRPVSRAVSLIFLLMVTLSVAILSLNMVNHFAAWQLLSGADYLAAFTPEQLEAAALFFLELHTEGYLIAQITFGGWLLPLGYVIYKSGYFPRFVGIVLMAGAVAYVLDTFLNLLMPGGYPEAVAAVVLAVPVLAEVSLFTSLVVKAVRRPRTDGGGTENGGTVPAAV